jgi:NAD(P)-dependent dehydrogenase (short-subunit alcohol dehydrogenase family)
VTNIDLTGKVALVTGGSAGIGLSIAELLCGAGASVAIVGRRKEVLEEAESHLVKKFPNGDVFSVSADTSKVSDIKEMTARVIERFGRIDILVNNAGTNVLNYALDVTEEEWDRVMDLNTKGLFFCCQEVGKHMVKQGSGKVINMASQMGLVGLYKRAAYCTSKGGVVQLTKVLGIEWAPYNIQVNAIAPTFVETPLTRPLLENKEFYDDVIRRIPMGKLAQPEDVAGAALYLASDLSNFVTGHTLPVDGGWVAW